MLVVPTYEELKQRVCELESRTLQTEQVEDAAVWDGLLRKPPVDNLPAGFAYFNEEFVLLDCNKAYKEFLRIHTPFTAEQASGMCHFDYKPDSSPYLEDWFRYVRDSGRAHTRYDLRLGITREGQHHISYWD
ncbi:MAG: hypothetical protein FJY85_02645, partial [Deltaproteobacteria bacterium]|nr:hypothetical protein [Deltaproteobacteria bacterium]